MGTFDEIELFALAVEAGSFAGRPHRPEPALLRLQAAGVPIAVVRQGDDLAVALAGVGAGELAHA